MPQSTVQLAKSLPNKGLELTAYSVRYAPASGSSQAWRVCRACCHARG